MRDSTRRGYQYQVASLLRAARKDSADQLTQADIDAFRASRSLSARSIEAAVKAAGILRGVKFGGDKLRLPHLRPKTVPLDDLSRVFTVAQKRGNTFVCRFLKWAFITGLRLEDLRNLRRDQMAQPVIEVEARKTGKLHLIPRHPILCCRLPDDEYPLRLAPGNLRKKLFKYCDLAKVPRFGPQMLRATAGDAYESAWAGAGGVLLGHSLGSVTMQSYVRQETILRRAQENLTIPPAMLPEGLRSEAKRSERQLLDNFRRMAPEDRAGLLRLVGRIG